MANINLRDLYPEYERNCYVEVPDVDLEAFVAAMTKEIADVHFEFERKDHAYHERRRYHRAYYSLDAGDGIENEAVQFAPSPEEIFMDKLSRSEIHTALAVLSEPQRRRIEAHIIDGKSKYEIARAEGVDESTVRESIEHGLRKLRKNLNDYF